MIKLSTWNLCLGLKNKKDYVVEMLRKEKIDICCMQEVELDKNFPIKNLQTRDYNFEAEVNTTKSRTGIYIRTNVCYVRRCDLEGSNNGLLIIDFNSTKNYRLINLYRTFNPQNGRTQFENFEAQLSIINNSIVENPQKNIIIVGDFNLDDAKRYSLNYQNHAMFNALLEAFDPHGLHQLINFPTWERLVNNILKYSTLDHVYVKDCTLVSELKSVQTEIGDHLLITFTLKGHTPEPKITMKRSWLSYSKEALLNELAKINFEVDTSNVQSLWNTLENHLIQIVDNLVPIVPHYENVTVASQKITPLIKNKINLRNRLLKKFKQTKDVNLKSRIKNLNTEIRFHFEQNKRKRVRQCIIPGNNKSLWTSVKLAKDLNTQQIPEKMTLNNVEVNVLEVPDTFASFFKEKISKIVNESRINNNVYNGQRKVDSVNNNFMNEQNVIEAVNSLKTKNCEGFDQIPQRILKDGIQFLSKPLTVLFDAIYKSKTVPEQWLVSKITPILKKGSPNQIENYRPIANLCSTSKIFEKLILQRLHQIEFENLVDLTNKSQHGFKKNRSTNSASLILQSVLARALDENNYAMMASLDLSAAFDVVNVELLLVRLRRIGLPDDVISLVGNWLSLRYYYVSVGGKCSIIHSLTVGTVQGSILGPILYAMFVSPLFDLAKMTKFADDNFIIRYCKVLSDLIDDMKQCLEMIIKWLKDSGLKVNDSKTEICLFHKADAHQINLEINGNIINSKPTMNVLGIIFDSKLQWGPQVENAILKSNKAKHAIMLIRKFFNKQELNTLLTSNFFSVLYYNSDVWHIPSLNPRLKQQILSASARALKLCTSNYNLTMSFIQIHTLNNRATPNQLMLYKHALLLYKIWNDKIYSDDWLSLNFQQNFNVRNSTVKLIDTSNLKIGKNIAVNRLMVINGLIEYDWLNLSINAYKIRCKTKFLV